MATSTITNRTIWETDFATAERKAGIAKAQRWCVQEDETERRRFANQRRGILRSRFLHFIATARQLYIPLAGYIFR